MLKKPADCCINMEKQSSEKEMELLKGIELKLIFIHLFDRGEVD